MSAGYIYALINSSMPGLVKVGRTSKEPSERAKELSTATGVATAFIVAYQRKFANCIAAEEQTHIILEHKGFRVSKNREFFEAPLHIIVETISSLPDQTSKAYNSPLNYTTEDDSTDIGEDLKEEGMRLILGDDTTFPNKKRGIQLLEKSASLGNTVACIFLGNLHLKGHVVPLDKDKALSYYERSLTPTAPHAYAIIYKTLLEESHLHEAQVVLRKLLNTFDKNVTHIAKDYELYREYEHALVRITEASKSYTSDPLLDKENTALLSSIRERINTEGHIQGLSNFEIALQEELNGNLQAALQFYEKAALLDNMPEAYFEAANLWDKINETEDQISLQAYEAYLKATQHGIWYAHGYVTSYLLFNLTSLNDTISIKQIEYHCREYMNKFSEWGDTLENSQKSKEEILENYMASQYIKTSLTQFLGSLTALSETGLIKSIKDTDFISALEKLESNLTKETALLNSTPETNENLQNVTKLISESNNMLGDIIQNFKSIRTKYASQNI